MVKGTITTQNKLGLLSLCNVIYRKKSIIADLVKRAPVIYYTAFTLVDELTTLHPTLY